jgi:hypothetical protein
MNDIFLFQFKHFEMDENSKIMQKNLIMKNMDKLKLYYSIEDSYKNEEKFDNFLKEFVIILPGVYKIMNEMDDIFRNIEVEESIVSDFKSNCLNNESVFLGKKRSSPSSEMTSLVETPKKKINEIDIQRQELTFRNVKEKINNVNLNSLSVSLSASASASNSKSNNSTSPENNLLLNKSDDTIKSRPSYETLISEYYSQSKTLSKTRIPVYRGLNSLLAGCIKTTPKTDQKHKKKKTNKVMGTIHSFFERYRIQEKLDENAENNMEDNTDSTSKEEYEIKPIKPTEPKNKYKISVRKDQNNDTFIVFSYEKEESDDEILAENTPTKSIKYKKCSISTSKTNLLKLFNQSNKI